MSAVNHLISKFESIAQQESPLAETTRRVRVKRYSMPLRQATLSFGTSPATSIRRRSTGLTTTSSKQVQRAATPPMDEVDSDTIVVNTSKTSPRVARHSLPTPSESATDASSESSSTSILKSPPRNRSKRVSSTRKSTSRETLVAPSVPSTNHEKQRNISGDTLVASAMTSQTSLLKGGIDALDMTWEIDHVDSKQEKTNHAHKQIDDQPVTGIAVEDTSNLKHKDQIKRTSISQNEKKWEQRRKAAEKDATRKSSRASLLTKATEVVSSITSSVLGKRSRDLPQKSKSRDEAIPGKRWSTIHQEPENKKPRLDIGGDNGSLAAARREMRSRAPKDKKWLTSGLYAGQSTTFNPTKSEARNKSKSMTNGTSSATTQPVKDNYVLPLPMFAGARLLETGRDFKLPFDVFSPLPSGQPKPDEWKKVNKNVFVGDAAAEWRTSKFLEHSTCMCKADTGCDQDCMNRYMYYECDERNCNLTKEQCGNRAFEGLRQRVKKGGKYNVGVEVLQTGDRGYGVRANRTFESNQIIVEYTGEVINQEECEDRMHRRYKDNECYYLMAFDQNMIIDATRGSIARFVNHSCDPSCRMEKWTVGGKPRMALFAGDRRIMTGEELTYDYNFDPYSQKNVQVCRCGSENCRGILGPKPKEVPKRPSPEVAAAADKEGKLAGAKRKIAEVLEESTSLLNKKRKTNEPPKLPKGWAYVEPEPKTKPYTKAVVVKEEGGDDGKLHRQPSKLRRMLSEKSRKSAKVQTSGRRSMGHRVTSTSSEAALITADGGDGMHERPTSSTVATLKAKAGSLKRSMSKSLRGR